ncbi:MAG: SH3 domain-containing protein [Roseburia sp.]|nr:SH3 domain-containing protein [Ruminococcus sp.]MCM1154079.1 SH3 domain-containing protein [Roseburia sp.]MCM1241999.1 SH3 domain-containing protein [Roseburia sp.]
MKKWWKHSKGSLLKGTIIMVCALLFFMAQPTLGRVQATGTASGAEIPAETPMDAQYAAIKVEVAKVRSGASTSNAVVDSLPQNTTVIISGQTAGSDKPWYYITFTGTDGTEKTGYVRSDLVNLGEMVPAPEPVEEPQPEEPVETVEPQPEPVQNADYELVYKMNDAGEYVWYLYDRTSGETYQQELEAVLNAAHAQSLNNALDAKTVVKQRIVIIVLAVIIVLLGIAVGVMIFKLRDVYYEDYEDEDDEDEEEEDDRRRESRRREDRGREDRGREERRRDERGREERGRESRSREDDKDAPRRKSAPRDDRQPAPRKRTSDSGRMPAREVSYEEDDAQVKTQPKRKAKNFMVDDDFEFEFLNMKDGGKDA